MREHRAFPRVPVHLEVRYETADELALSIVQSLSQGGVFIRTSKPLPIGTELVMDLKLPEGEGGAEELLRVRGKVVWERLLGRDGGMGVVFLGEIPDRLKKLLTSRAA